MAYATKRGVYAGAAVTLVCVFDPTSVRDGDGADYTYDGMMRQKTGVLYTGRIFAPTGASKGKDQVFMEKAQQS